MWNSTTVITPVPLFAIECATFDGTMTPMSGPSFSTWVPIVMSNVPVQPDVGLLSRVVMKHRR